MIKRLIQRALGVLGYRISRQKRQLTKGGATWSRDPLEGIDLKVNTVVDIGVADGTPTLYDVFSKCKLVLIEPIGEFESLVRKLLGERADRTDFLNVAAGSKTGMINLFINPRLVHQSSFYKRSVHSDKDIREVSVDTLDNLVFEKYRPPFFIKIDVEGAELDVLNGACNTLEMTNGVIVEVNMGFKFEKARNPIPAVDELLKKKGFTLYSVMDAIVEDSGGPKVTKCDLFYVKDVEEAKV